MFRLQGGICQHGMQHIAFLVFRTKFGILPLVTEEERIRLNKDVLR